MTSTISVASMTPSAYFHQEITKLDLFDNPGTKVTYSVLIMWVGSSKSKKYFLDF
jgi:hypothetical protein